MKKLGLFLVVLGLSLGTNQKNSISCSICHDMFNVAQSVADNKDTWVIPIEMAIAGCTAASSLGYEVCKGAVNEMAYIALDSLSDHYLDPEYMCYTLDMCTSPSYYNANFTNWLTKVFEDKPSSTQQPVSSGETFLFGQMTDMHIDMFYQEGSNADCGIPECCREWLGKGNAGYWGDYNCDIPIRTFELGVKQMSELNLDFVMWTGDVPPHDVWNQSQAYNLQYQKIASDVFKKHFPETPVYTVFGNHACYPVNVYDPDNAGWLLDPISEMWGYWLPESAKETIRAMGTYSIQHKNTNLRILTINTQVCNNLNFYLFKNVTDPNGQLEWIWNELAGAEARGEQVYILGHIPMGDSDCLNQWAERFNALVDRYSHIILAQYYGHTHKDHFFINRGVHDNKPRSIQWVSPSVTTYTNKNPSFRVFEADTSSFVLKNIHQYRLNIPQANKQTNPKYELAYSFLEYYNLQDLSPETIANWVEEMKHSEEKIMKWYQNYQTGGPDTPKGCDEACRNQTTCMLGNGLASAVAECKGAKASLLNTFLEALFGKWTYKRN